MSDERNLRCAPKRYGVLKTPKQQSSFAAQNLEDLALYDVEAEDCHECGRKLTAVGHFNAYLCCTKCRYSSCCSKAMSVHVQLFHTPLQKPVFEIGAAVHLDKDIFCCCGFVTKSGNKMGKFRLSDIHFQSSPALCASLAPFRDHTTRYARTVPLLIVH